MSRCLRCVPELERMHSNSSEFRSKQFIVDEGVRIAADVGGEPSAPSVLLLHGGGQTRHSWSGAMRELVNRGYYVVNLDARGHGDSDWSHDGNYSLDALASDLRNIIRTLHAKPVLVGASMGGATALHVVGFHPESIASALVLVDIVPLMSAQGASKIRAFMRANTGGFATIQEAADAVTAYNPTRVPPKDLSGLMKNLRRKADGRLYWHWDPRFINAPGAEPPLDRDLASAADRVTIPTLLVRGLKSDLVTEEGIVDLKRRIPHLELFNVDGAGHMVAGDKNDAFNLGLLEFLQRRLPT
jgi:pimeloyl-ACP methyl ester carboxylesterase